MIQTFNPRDFIAGIVIIGGFILLFFGKNGDILALLAAVIGFYFGAHTAGKGGLKDNGDASEKKINS